MLGVNYITLLASPLSRYIFMKQVVHVEMYQEVFIYVWRLWRNVFIDTVILIFTKMLLIPIWFCLITNGMQVLVSVCA